MNRARYTYRLSRLNPIKHLLNAMKPVFRDMTGPTLFARGCVACIGAFDGLHHGHRALLQHTVARARVFGVPAVALAFEPLPREFFLKDNPPARLTLIRNRVIALHKLGIQSVGLLRFDARMAATPAPDFVRQTLVQRLRIREVWIGPGFHFGHQRGGHLALLQSMGKELGFMAGEIAPVYCRDGQRVSSTRIRTLLRSGEFAQASELLGQPYCIAGRVVRGRALGRTLGFATANIRFNKTPPFSGIYATKIHGVGQQPWPAVSSFGTRPTVEGIEPLLEAHLFDFNGDLYGKHIEVEFIAKLRDEVRFDNLPALVQQMQIDADNARALLNCPRLTTDLLAP